MTLGITEDEAAVVVEHLLSFCWIFGTFATRKNRQLLGVFWNLFLPLLVSFGLLPQERHLAVVYAARQEGSMISLPKVGGFTCSHLIDQSCDVFPLKFLVLREYSHLPGSAAWREFRKEMGCHADVRPSTGFI